MIAAFINCFKIRELRDRILLTLGLIFVARLGAHIPLPGIDSKPIEDFVDEMTRRSGQGGMLGLLSIFTGGALRSGSILALGIMPYINASIFMQLFVAVEPHLARLAQEGDVGRQKISQYTRYATIGIAVIQAMMILYVFTYFPESLMQGFHPDPAHPIIIMPGGKPLFIFCGVIILTAGAMLLMWIGEQITQFGIGNGTSLLITVNILSNLPTAANLIWTRLHPGVEAEATGISSVQLIPMVLLLVAVVAGVVALTQGERKIPVHYAKRVVGRRVFQSQSNFLPLKINYSGVMPIIFASAILMLPYQLFSFLHATFGVTVFQSLADFVMRGTNTYYLVYTFLIFVFSFFWVALMFKPIQVADDLKKYGGYIPGVPPGEPTAKFLDFTMTRLTLAGAVFLTIIAVLPNLLYDQVHVDWVVAQFFGGTSTLIIVGVLLDTMRQVETFLLQRHYDGFLRKGRAKSNASRATQSIDQQEIRNLRPLWLPLAVLLLMGIAAWIFNRSHLG